MNSLRPFLHATGVENSCPTISGGARIDQMDRCGHYARWEDDFALVRESGLNALRYGPAYYRVHVGPDHYDWDVCDAQMHRLRALEITVIASLCHFGVPSWLGGFQDEAFPVLFAACAGAFARRYPWIRHFTPVNAIFTCAANSALRGWWNECESSVGAFVRAMRNLCMAHELAVEAILAERPDAIIVQGESPEPYRPGEFGGAMDAERWSALAMLPTDLTTGHELAPGMARLLNEHGVASNDLSFFRERRAVGQRWLGAESPALGSMHHRYGLPLLQAVGHSASEPAADWLEHCWQEGSAMRASGIAVTGFAWFPLTDRLGWQQTAHAGAQAPQPVGLYDLRRRIRPVGERYRELVRACREGSSAEGAAEAASA
jgi:hypothetical protein